ncbi:MAG: DUF2934 domain-containing protein [Terracidiphilus sp.]|jgi:hypothetical protein
MAETVKKTKATAKPRKTATTNDKVTQVAKTATPPREEIERLAKRFWADRGYQDGHAEQDWLRAEQQLLQKAS